MFHACLEIFSGKRMPGIRADRTSFSCSWYTCVLLVILLATVRCCHGFNVDIDSALVHRGEKNTKFGYRAEFVKEREGSTRLLVSAPHFRPDNRSSSGKYFLCDPLQQTCADRKAMPLINRQDSTETTFGEKEEMFGLTVSLVNSSTALVCGPLWVDLAPNRGTYSFQVGRCQLIPPGRSSMSPMTKNLSEYIAKIRLDDYWTVGLLKGLAQFGFSAATDGKGQTVIGVPGFSAGRGSFGVLDLKNEDFDMMDKDFFDPEADALLGFSVATGNFCGNVTVCFAVSSRMPNGKVYIVEREKQQVFRQTQMFKDPQDYSSFGFSLCAMDVNGDGLSDLLVGAPTYSDHSKAPISYDEGRVFVYLQLQGKLTEKVHLAGGRKNFARFGSAVGDVGDLSRDSIHDVAVGAPQEDEGRGAVYIYLGSSGGPATTYSQRISGRDVDKGLFSFGSHISQPTSDLSPYQYPDFAVGSPESDAVVFLRTRLIINAEVNIVTPPSPISSSNSDCPAHISPGSVKASGCILLQVCLNVSVREKQFERRNVSFDVSLQLDTLVTIEGYRRLRLYRPDTDTTSTSVVNTLSVISKQGHCERYIAVLAEENIFKNPYEPVNLDASFALNATSLKGTVKPILNTSLPTSTSRELRFRNRCDLVLKGNVLHVPPEDDLNLNIVNKTSEVVLELSLWNKQETAFGIRLAVAIKGQIQFRTATDGDGGSQFACKDISHPDDIHPASSLTCDRFLPLEQGAALSFSLLFEAASVPLLTSPSVTFNVTAIPYDLLSNPESSTADNSVTLESRRTIIADTQIYGSSDPRALYAYDSDLTDLQVTHRLLVTNRGPSFLPATHVRISLPYLDLDGRELVASHAVTTKQSDGTEEQCPPDSLLRVDVARTRQPTPAWSYDRVTTSREPSVSHLPTTTSQGTQSEKVKPSRLSQSENIAVETRETSTQTRESYLSVLMDCHTYRCQTFLCSLPTLQRHEQAEINISVVLTGAFLPFSRQVDTVRYVTSSKVEEPSSPFFYRWTDARSERVFTSIHKITSATHEEVNIWIIIGGVVGGLLLLAMIIVILKRVGFFRRADKVKLERLKRQSGYYDIKRRPANKDHRLDATVETEQPEVDKD